MTKETRVYTVSELTKDVRSVLEDTFGGVWVEGEVSNFVLSSAGHSYFSLKDEGSVINCVLFKSSGARLAFDPEDGMKVLCKGRISVYDKRGQYQLYVSSMEPKGKGALQIAFEKLKKKLYEEGLFDKEIKKELPYLPGRIGVVTSPTGAAVRDIINVARRRYSNIEISISPVKVQGDEAKFEIAKAIEDLNEYNELIASGEIDEHPIDVLVVGRGGGSLEDLWAFNEEIVARAIAASEIPVISAVGHEIDYTISDFTADMRAPTPSAAAELVMPRKEELSQRVDEVFERMHLAASNKIASLEQKVERLKASYVLKDPLNVFKQLGERVDDLLKNATTEIMHSVEMSRSEFGRVAGKLNVLSPLAVLDRGYSITFKDANAVKKASDLKKGDTIRTLLLEGEVKSIVEEVKASGEKK